MKRFIVNLIIIIICFLFQTTIFPMISVKSIIPNIMVVFVACAGFMQGSRYGLLVGFASGLLMDIYSFDIFGFYTILYMIIGFTNGFIHNYFYLKDFKTPALLITLTNIFTSLSIYVVLFLFRAKFEFLDYLINIIIPEIAFTLLISVIFYPLLWLVEANIFEKKKSESQ